MAPRGRRRAAIKAIPSRNKRPRDSPITHYDESMDRLQAMHMFVRVVETGSFSKAAREFATTQPTVTKQVAAIETRLKVRLLNRNTRGVSLTEAGSLYYERCKAIVRDAQEADHVVQSRQGQAQ